ncbi:hypothetical protein GIB67_030825 [Kingdonia uniflora]|uniref:DUF7792 domain-containing protein n=1 Tax=Kingdonia uniflora TaxID=39325 RepID=A0A7J7L358_9MAGN|nr:hypothetical protein GIB67_030825 [Kingdonia uniflora]
MMELEAKGIKETLSLTILLSERVRKLAEEAQTFKNECSIIAKQADHLSQMLRSLVRLSNTTPSLYQNPIRRIALQLWKNLGYALSLARKCRRTNILRRVFTIISAADFRKLNSYLDTSLGDLKWVLNVLDCGAGGGGIGIGIDFSLPPIASNDPILAWVWSYIAALQMGSLEDRLQAANEIGSFALDNERYKKMIVEENGVPPLLKLLKEGGIKGDTNKIAAATALSNLANDEGRVREIVEENGVPVIVQVLSDSCLTMKVLISVANLVSRMAEYDEVAKEEFARENVIMPLVSLLAFETFSEKSNSGKPKTISKETGTSSSSNHHRARDRENEKDEVKLQLKIKCAEALRFLLKNSVVNSQKITETKGLLCLAKCIENQQGELKLHCLMAVMEIAAAVECNADLRQSAFKTNSSAAKTTVEQLLRVIEEESNPVFQIPAIKSIGLLARTFPSRETRVVRPLVTQLRHTNTEVAAEALIALTKFACLENYLRVQHSKTIMELDGVPSLMRLLRANAYSQTQGLILLCYLAINVGNSEDLEEARASTALEVAARSPVAQHPLLRELIPKAIEHLELYQAGISPEDTPMNTSAFSFELQSFRYSGRKDSKVY